MANKYREILFTFFSHRGVDNDPSCAIRDWVDADEEECSDNCRGAESDRYRNLEDPYEARTGPMESLEELRMIEGIDADIFREVSPFLTPFRRDQLNSEQVNVNTAPLEVLLALDFQMEPSGMAESIIETRKDAPFINEADFRNRTLIDVDILNKIRPYIKYNSGVFTVIAAADVQGVQKTIQATLKRDDQGGTRIFYWRVD
jgi:general secretion pathway protein K